MEAVEYSHLGQADPCSATHGLGFFGGGSRSGQA